MPLKLPDELTREEWLIERFEQGYERKSRTECWPWLKAKVTDGYGTIALQSGIPLATHRVAYELNFGPIPANMVVRHTCNNASCVNPNHLTLGDHLDNVVDRILTSNFGKLHLQDVLNIRKDTRVQRIIAKEYGISQSLVSRIKSGERWTNEIIEKVKERLT